MADIARRTGGDKAVIPACAMLALSPLGLYFFIEARMYPLFLLCLLVTAWTSFVLRDEGGSLWQYLLWIASSTAGLLTHYFFLFPWLAMIAFLLLTPGQFETAKAHRGRGRRRILSSCLGIWRLPDTLDQWRVTGGWLDHTADEVPAIARYAVINSFSSSLLERPAFGDTIAGLLWQRLRPL